MRGIEVEEGEHLDVIGDGRPRLESDAGLSEPRAAELAKLCQALRLNGCRYVMLTLQEAEQLLSERARRRLALTSPGELAWQQRALLAEARLANAQRLLDDYRERNAPFPTYAQMMRALQG